MITLAAVTSANAGGVVTIAPTGDMTGEADWTNIQMALMEATPGTTIELGAGTFYLGKVLLAEDFRGTFRGAGKELTFITSVGELEVSPDDPPWLNPPSLDNPWAALITFLDGKFTLSDMTFQVTEPIPMTANLYGGVYEVMHTVIMVAGSETPDQVSSSIRDVGLEGAAGTFGGYNVINGISHGGFLGSRSPGTTSSPGAPSRRSTGDLSSTTRRGTSS
jgi:hypothetical protein